MQNQINPISFYLILLFSSISIKAMDVADIKKEVMRHLTKNVKLDHAIKDIKAFALTNKSNSVLFNKVEVTDKIIDLLAHQFCINKPYIAKSLQMTGSRQWLKIFEMRRPLNLNTLFLESLLNDDKNNVFSLLNQGAEINSQIKSMPALIFLVMNRNHEMVRFLLKNGADVNIQNLEGETSLICATKLKDMPMLHLLNEFGANKDIKSNDGLTALDWATLLS